MLLQRHVYLQPHVGMGNKRVLTYLTHLVEEGEGHVHFAASKVKPTLTFMKYI